MATDSEGRRPSFGEQRRRRAVLAATVAIAALLLTACGKDGGTPDPASTSTGGSGAIGGAPNSESPSAETTGGPNASATGPTFPKDARSYAFEVLKAWSSSNQPRINQLADSSTIQQIKDSTGTKGAPNGNWTYGGCSPSGDKTACTYFNANGDKCVVMTLNAKLGAPNAATAAQLDRTEFGTSTTSYVDDWIAAWSDKNYPRMTAYSNANVTNYFKSRTPITSRNTDPPTTEGGKTYVRIAGTGSDLGRSEVLQVDTTKISQGKPGGIIGYKTNP